MSMLVYAIVFCYAMPVPSGQCKQYSQFYENPVDCAKALRAMTGPSGIPNLTCRSRHIEVWE